MHRAKRQRRANAQIENTECSPALTCGPETKGSSKHSQVETAPEVSKDNEPCLRMHRAKRQRRGNAQVKIPAASSDAPVSVVMPVALDFTTAQWDEEQLSTLPKKPVLLKLGTTIEYGSISYALLELSMRCTRSDISFLCPVTAAPLTVPGSLTASEEESLLAARATLKLDTCAVFYAVVGSNGHFVLLEAEPPQPGQSRWKLTYYDSLKQPSKQCMLSVQTLANRLMFEQSIPKPSNKRYQSDGWSCGLWCMQFLEESIRARCGEKLQHIPMDFNYLITRTNMFIAMASKEINKAFPDADARKAALAAASKGVTAEKESNRILQAETALEGCKEKEPCLRNCSVAAVAGDGFCLFRAICLQCGLVGPADHMHLASATLLHMAHNREKYEEFITEEFWEERQASLLAHDLNVKKWDLQKDRKQDRLSLYILDRCCGLHDDDWSALRRYADGVLVQGVVDWSGLSLLIVSVEGDGGCRLRDPIVRREEGLSSMPCLKVAHYDSPTFEHFDAIVQTDRVSVAAGDALRVKWEKDLADHLAWRHDVVDLMLILEDLQVPVRISGEPGDASDSESSGCEQEELEEHHHETGPSFDALHCSPCSPHPRALYEARVLRLAEEIRADWRLPLHLDGSGFVADEYDNGVWIPPVHCVWRHCVWRGDDEETLLEHIDQKHPSDLLEQCIEHHHPALTRNMKLFTVVSHALRLTSQGEPPFACSSIDRRSLCMLYDHLKGEESVQALICFSCACSHPVIKDWRWPAIEYHDAWRTWRVGQGTGLFGLTSDQTEAFFGIRAYLKLYGKASGGAVNLAEAPFREEFVDWTRDLRIGEETVQILRCPEDVTCHQHEGTQKEICKNCRVPLCASCAQAVFHRPAKQPARTLANDFWVGYASDIIHKHHVTYLELLCASPCVLSLVCFVLEGQRGGGTFHEEAHMQRHRVGIRGNVTLFPLPLEDVARELRELSQSSPLALPHTGAVLQDRIRVLLKGQGKLPAAIITQATVRRQVVLELIEECCRQGHPAYAGVDMAAVRKRAEALPEFGPLEELVDLRDPDDSLDKIRPQKAATPHAVAASLEEALADVRPNAVTMEKSGVDVEDAVEAPAQAWAHVEGDLKGRGELIISTSSTMLNLLDPTFLATAYPFLFKRIGACPDLDKRGSRRVAGAPRIYIPEYIATMIRRIESQFRADWSFGYSLWNTHFRRQVNACRMVISMASVDGTADNAVRGPDLAKAATEVCAALRGSYRTLDGEVRPVAGDLSKAYYAPGMSPAARTMLRNASYASQTIAGTQETRRKMRFVMHSFRVAFGMPVFITVSPDEKHNAIMLRFCRLREADPAVRFHPSHARWHRRSEPPLVAWTTKPETEELTYDLRRNMMARSPLCAADGFKVHMHLLLRYVFGIRTCLRCPNCHAGAVQGIQPDWCCDAEGSASVLLGGVLGRIAAYVGSVESQKSGSLHLHFHAFVECAHQQKSLREIADLIRARYDKIVAQYLRYAETVRCAVYPQTVSEADLKKCEDSWPEHRDTQTLCALPEYQGWRPKDAAAASVEEGKRWLMEYHKDQQQVMLRRQHHIHVPDANGVRQPLAACRRPGTKDCKHGFPCTKQICTQCSVVCDGLAKSMDLPRQGRRSMIGCLQVPRNHEFVNECIPAVLAAARNNNDIKLPFRLPILTSTHSKTCKEDCVAKFQAGRMAEAIEASQHASVGYCCDYTTKRLSVGVYECKEWAKGHRVLNQQLQGETPGYTARRHVQRIMSDCFARGIVRGAVEAANLCSHATIPECTAAEMMVSSDTAVFSGASYLRAFDMGSKITLARGPLKRTPTPKDDMSRVCSAHLDVKDIGVLYGLRGKHPAIRYLSPWEFVRYWEVLPKDMVRRADVWVEFPTQDTYAALTTGWVLRRRWVPVVPLFAGCPIPKRSVQRDSRSAKLLLVYFQPWTLRESDACEECPLAADVTAGKGVGEGNQLSWKQVCQAWLGRGLLTEEMRQVVHNFSVVYRLRPRDPDATGDNSDNAVSDEECFVSNETLKEALETKLGGRAGRIASEGEGTRANAEAGVTVIRSMWPAAERTGDRCKKMLLSHHDVKKILKDMRKQANESKDGQSAAGRREHHASARVVRYPTWAEAQAWLDKNRDGLSDEQKSFLAMVAKRCYTEIEEDSVEGAPRSEPLRWVLHGKPGTGKSHVLRLLFRFFEEILGWKLGVQYCVSALQATMAAAIGGDTLHHTAGINPFFQACGLGPADASMASRNLQQRMMCCRWLVVDEAFMLSSQLISEVDVKLRAGVSDASPYKKTSAGTPRVFGGLNVLLAGDMYQLDPPEGLPLYAIPRALKPADPKKETSMMGAHGLHLIWGIESDGFKGITDMTTRFRCRDDWWNSVLDEMRTLSLSSDTHSFLHGLETTVPGSWCKDKPECKNATCASLVAAWKTSNLSWAEKQRQECEVCAADRITRCRLLGDGAADMLAHKDFECVPCAVPNNDLRYEINKVRAEVFATKRRLQLFWCPAKDIVSPDVLRDDPQVVQKKVSWLQRHERHTGGLSGMLPLVCGMPVCLADHVERSEQRLLLKGACGHIHSVSLHPDDEKNCRGKDVYVLQHLPTCVYVKFENADWTVPGLDIPGLYPVTVASKNWFLDRHRAQPRLKITRRQLCLVPGFAKTVHSMQGADLPTLIVDVLSSNGQTCYVALSRTKTRGGTWLMRPFPLSMFQKRPPLGQEILLRKLKGESLDSLKTELRSRMPPKESDSRGAPRDPLLNCSRCGPQLRSSFTSAQLERQEGRLCMKCVPRKMRGACLELLPRETFSQKQWESDDHSRRCTDCVDQDADDTKKMDGACMESQDAKECKKKLCCRCKNELPRTEFPQRSWRQDNDLSRICLRCSKKEEQRLCCHCKKSFPRAAFSIAQWRKEDLERTCTCCVIDITITKKCCRCQRGLHRTGFSQKAWGCNDEQSRTCLACLTDHRTYECSICGLKKGEYEFAICKEKTPSYMQRLQQRRCNACIREAEEQKQKCHQDGLRHVIKRPRIL